MFLLFRNLSLVEDYLWDQIVLSDQHLDFCVFHNAHFFQTLIRFHCLTSVEQIKACVGVLVKTREFVQPGINTIIYLIDASLPMQTKFHLSLLAIKLFMVQDHMNLYDVIVLVDLEIVDCKVVIASFERLL